MQRWVNDSSGFDSYQPQRGQMACPESAEPVLRAKRLEAPHLDKRACAMGNPGRVASDTRVDARYRYHLNVPWRDMVQPGSLCALEAAHPETRLGLKEQPWLLTWAIRWGRECGISAAVAPSWDRPPIELHTSTFLCCAHQSSPRSTAYLSLVWVSCSAKKSRFHLLWANFSLRCKTGSWETQKTTHRSHETLLVQ
jgi:hypothetical protein